MSKKTTKQATVFIGTFISVLLLLFGVGTLLAMILPVIVQLSGSTKYQPILPLANARTEEFIDINSIPAKQLYPPLTGTENIDQGNWIRIPAVDINVPLVEAASINDKDILAILDRGAALYPNGVFPGRLGNVFISAHSTGEPWKGKYRFAFLRINEVAPGNLIHLDHNGTRYTYRVTGTDIIEPNPDYRIISDRPVPTLAFMACWPLWTTDKRMLKYAELTNITQLTQAKPIATVI